MSDISLTASMRTNLLALQNTQSLVDRTQERLSTGLKVNSALDNASSYYAARSLNNRASDLSSLLDSMGQGIQTIKAATEGVEAITDFVEQAKAIASSARDTTDDDSRAKYMTQFNEILDQIDTLAKDSSYKGINLLNKETLTVTFNETIKNPSKVEIEGVDASSAGLDMSPVENWTKASQKPVDEAKLNELLSADEQEKIKSGVKVSDEKIAEIKDGLRGTETMIVGKKNDGSDNEVTIPAKGTAWDPDVVTAWLNSKTGIDGKYAYDTTDSKYTFTPTGGTATDVAQSEVDEAVAALDQQADKALEKAAKESADYATALEEAENEALQTEAAQILANQGISDTLETVSKAINSLRDYASQFGNYNTIVQTRQEFTKNLINVLTEGADNLTLADMNEESANMLALQTRQQLGVNSLSLASQAAQSVLALF